MPRGDTQGHPSAADGPDFETVAAACGDAVVATGSSAAWTLRRTGFALPDDHGAEVVGARELAMAMWSADGVYGGEVPTACFRRPKPRLRDVLDRGAGTDRYRLSPRACRGVLDRDVGRGRPLPERLQRALRAAAASAGEGAADA